MATRYIAYYRVSTTRQGHSGLGLEAQRVATNNFLRSSDAVLLAECTEVESGKRANRPELKAAVQACRERGATLLIAKLDRLARNVHFISGLLESGVRFTAIDMPNADRFMLHVYAAMAEEEARRISDRTKAALSAAKARGVKLGSNGASLARVNRENADVYARKVGPLILAMLEEEGVSYRAAANILNKSNIVSYGGKGWHATSVYRVASRFRSLSAIPL